MGSTQTPTQNIILDPYQASIFDYDTFSSKIFISDQINELLVPFGNNVILNGYDLLTLTMSNDYSIQCELNYGMCIIDKTLIEYKENSIIDINCLNYDDAGYFIISIAYDSVRSSYMNKSKIGIYYVNSNDDTDNIFINQNNVILYIISFNKETKTVTNTSESSKTINNKYYDVYPLDDHRKELIKLINVNSIFN